jgi:site-specific recombinase XerD
MEKQEEFLKQFISKYTRKNYAAVLNSFREYNKSNVIPSGNLWVKDFTNFLLSAGKSNKTVNYHINVLSTYRKWLTGKKIEYDRLKEKPANTDFLTKDEVNMLIQKAEMPFLAVLKVMIDTGCRVGELEWLSRQNFTSVSKEIILTGKGLKQRVVIISDDTYRTLYKTFQNGKIFGREWSVRSIQYNLKKLVEKSGIQKRIHPHMLRHTMATHMLWDGINIQDIQKMLGHNFLSTTERYTHITQERVKDVWRKHFDKIT